MTAIKVKAKPRTILDFSGTNKCSKSSIKRSLDNCDIISVGASEDKFTLFLNQIKIGMYTIELELPLDVSPSWHRLKEYGDFQVSISDDKWIDLKHDGRFRNQYWVANNFFGKLHIKHLVDIIKYCTRLNQLRVFS